MREVHGGYFFGNTISEYGLENGRVDYATLAKSFNHVMNNEIIRNTYEYGEWEVVNGSEEHYEDTDGNWYDADEARERIEELESDLEELDELEELTEEQEERHAEIEAEIESLGDPIYKEVYQYFIIDGNGYDILSHWTDEIVWYNEALDMYVWGVTHYGTSWDYVLTEIKCNAKEA